MWKAPWKSLVESLERPDSERPYLDRLSNRFDAGSGSESLQREILQEMAYALRRAEDKVKAALGELEAARRSLARAPDTPDRPARIETYNRRREVAVLARWELAVHREAIGLLHNEELETLYPIPARIAGDTD